MKKINFAFILIAFACLTMVASTKAYSNVIDQPCEISIGATDVDLVNLVEGVTVVNQNQVAMDNHVDQLGEKVRVVIIGTADIGATMTALLYAYRSNHDYNLIVYESDFDQIHSKQTYPEKVDFNREILLQRFEITRSNDLDIEELSIRLEKLHEYSYSRYLEADQNLQGLQALSKLESNRVKHQALSGLGANRWPSNQHLLRNQSKQILNC